MYSVRYFVAVHVLSSLLPHRTACGIHTHDRCTQYRSARNFIARRNTGLRNLKFPTMDDRIGINLGRRRFEAKSIKKFPFRITISSINEAFNDLHIYIYILRAKKLGILILFILDALRTYILSTLLQFCYSVEKFVST